MSRLGGSEEALQLYFDCCGNEDMTAAQIFEAGSKTELMEEFDHAKISCLFPKTHLESPMPYKMILVIKNRVTTSVIM